MDPSPYIQTILSGAITAALGAFTCYVAMTNRLTKLETLLDQLSYTVKNLNDMGARIARIESDIKSAFTSINDVKHRIEKLEDDCK